MQNIAVISHLHKGQRHKFIQLIDAYFANGMDKLIENKAQVEPVSEQLLEVLEDEHGKQAVASLVKQWAGLKKLRDHYNSYLGKNSQEQSTDKKIRLSTSCAPRSIPSLSAARRPQAAR